jgi:hypothetical protein
MQLLVFKVLIFIVNSQKRGAQWKFPLLLRKYIYLGEIMKATKRRVSSTTKRGAVANKCSKKREYKSRKTSGFMRWISKWFRSLFSVKSAKKQSTKKADPKRKAVRKVTRKAAPKRAYSRRKTTKTVTKTAAKRNGARRKAA